MEDNIVTKSIGEFLNQTKNRYNLANEQKIIKAGESPVKRKPFSFWYKLFSSPIRVIGLLALLLAIFFAMAGYKNWEDFFANASVELASIAITILILDYLNEQREDKKLKEQLIRELRSPDSGIALRSLEELRSHDWVSDGSLRGAFLQFANLQKAGLYDADLRGAHLAAANLKDAIFSEAKMENVDLADSDLKGAYNLSDHQLSSVLRLWCAKMPDGNPYDGRYNLKGDLVEAKLLELDILDPKVMADFYGVSLRRYKKGQEWAKEKISK